MPSFIEVSLGFVHMRDETLKLKASRLLLLFRLYSIMSIFLLHEWPLFCYALFLLFFLSFLAIFNEKCVCNLFYFRDLLDEARVFHLIPERRPLLQSFRTKQRACEVRGHIYVVGGLNRHGIFFNQTTFFATKLFSFFQAIL